MAREPNATDQLKAAEGAAMQKTITGQRVCIYLSEADTWRHQPTYTAVLELLRREGCAGATVVRGIMGFTHGQLHTAALVELSSELPIVIDWVDTPECVQRLLPALCAMTPDGLVTVETVQVVKYPQRALRDVQPDRRVRDIMTPAERVVTAPIDADLHELVLLLLRKGRHAVPVLDNEQRVIGIITNRDLIERAGLPLRLELLRALGDPEEAPIARHLAGLRGEGRTAASIMTREVVTTSPDTPVAEVATLMLKRRLKRLPVVDREGRLVGLVSRLDVLKTAVDGGRQPDEDAPAFTGPAGRLPRQVGEVMNRYVPTVHPTTPLPEVLDAVMATRLHRAVVVDDGGKPVGIVVDTDLLQRVTPSAHPGLIQRLMRRVLPSAPESREEWQRSTGQQAVDVMRSRERMLVAPINAPIAEVIDRSLAQRIKLIVVVDDAGKVVGMADRADLLAALAAAG